MNTKIERLYKGKPVPKTKPNHYGYIYLLTIQHKGSIHYYIGKKKFFTETKKNFTQKQIEAMPNKRLKKYSMIIAESKWRSYTSSSKVFGSKDVIKKEIIALARSKRELTYLEEFHLFNNDVLNPRNNFFNVSIGNRFFRGNLV